jgi:hypothetical protein
MVNVYFAYSFDLTSRRTWPTFIAKKNGYDR